MHGHVIVVGDRQSNWLNMTISMIHNISFTDIGSPQSSSKSICRIKRPTTHSNMFKYFHGLS